MLNTIKLGILLLCCLLTAACVKDTGIREEFDKSVKAYNRMLRWHEMDAAGALYMVPEQREAFATAAGKINKKDLSITDFRILTMECLAEKESGNALVEFDYFILPSNRIKTLTYKQEWVYYEINEKKSWKVKSALPVFK
jgi:hypothetical protein